MNGEPWEQRLWIWARVKELAWTSLGTVQLAFWLVLGVVLYLALFTRRDVQTVAVISALIPIVIGLAATYSARRVGDHAIESRANGAAAMPPDVIFQPGQDDPTR
jgi:hypothetical protein